MELEGYIHSCESFGSVDGPGVRYLIFFAGCNMRCKFCHNPDTWKMTKGKKYSAKQLIQTALRYQSYWGKDGGITISGGEPLLQIDFLIELLKEAKKYDINTAIDTCGNPFTKDETFLNKFNELLKYTDLIMLDIKHIDNQKHLKLCGQVNTNILEMAKYLSEVNKPVWIRHVLVPTISDFDEDLISLNSFIETLKNVKKVEVLPYHTLGVFKWKELGYKYELENVNPPSDERIKNANKLLHTNKY